MRVIGLNDVIFRHHSGANSADALYFQDLVRVGEARQQSLLHR